MDPKDHETIYQDIHRLGAEAREYRQRIQDLEEHMIRLNIIIGDLRERVQELWLNRAGT